MGPDDECPTGSPVKSSPGHPGLTFTVVAVQMVPIIEHNQHLRAVPRPHNLLTARWPLATRRQAPGNSLESEVFWQRDFSRSRDPPRPSGFWPGETDGWRLIVDMADRAVVVPLLPATCVFRSAATKSSSCSSAAPGLRAGSRTDPPLMSTIDANVRRIRKV